MIRYYIFFIILFSTHISVVKAQVPTRARVYFDRAMKLESKKDFSAAKRTMEKAVLAYPGYREAYSLLGFWYFRDRHYADAVRVFHEAYTRFPEQKTAFSYPLARSLVYQGQVSEAMALISTDTEQGLTLQKQAQFIAQTMRTAWKDTVFPVVRINTSDPEFFPWIAADGETLFFTRRIKKANEDFLFTRRDSCGGWFTGQHMGLPLNSPDQETALSVSADGHYLFFTKCDNRSENGWGNGGCDLYMSYTADSIWSPPQSFGATINTPGYEGMPCLSPDNRELYFVSNRPGGYGGMDIWMARFENGLWQQPRNLGPQINTPGDETAPFLHTDNRTLYFASNGHQGMGGNDLFIARKVRDTVWSKPVNMGYPVNTTADENSLCITMDGTRIFFASDRDSTAGNFNIYEMSLPVPLQPAPVVPVAGHAYDSLTGGRLNFTSIYITDPVTGEQLYHFNSNRGDGSFTFMLSPEKTYAWKAYRVGYQQGEGIIDLRSKDTSRVNYTIALLPQDYVAPVNDSILLTIHFPLNSKTLSEADKNTLVQALLPWLYQQAGIIWFVNGYTDNTGTPMLNEQLSYTRAGLVTEELVTLGIDPLHIQTRGWGEAAPVADNDTEEGRDTNRRVEVIIRR